MCFLLEGMMIINKCEKWLCIFTFERLLPWSHLERRQINSLRPRQNRRNFADDIFKGIFLNENVWIWINISLKFVRKGPIDHIPSLVQIMAWRRPGDKPLSEPMMISLPTHICVTRPQWVNTTRVLIFCDGIIQVIARCRQAISHYLSKCCRHVSLRKCLPL